MALLGAKWDGWRETADAKALRCRVNQCSKLRGVMTARASQATQGPGALARADIGACVSSTARACVNSGVFANFAANRGGVVASSTAARGPGEGSDTIEAIQLRLRKRATWLVGRGPVTTCGVRTQDNWII